MKEVKGYIKATSKNQHGYYSICVVDSKKEDHWIGVKAKELKWEDIDLRKGLTVSASYDPDTFNNAVSIAVVETKTKSNKGYKKYYTGVEVGHAVNGAFYLTKHKKLNVVEEAKKVAEVTQKIKQEYSEKNPDLSDYDAGASVGHAVLNACKIIGSVTSKSIEDLEELSNKVLDTLIEPVTDFIKESKKDKTAEKKEETKQQEETPEKDSSDENTDDFEDDIPF
jgi:hypothetical protein